MPYSTSRFSLPPNNEPPTGGPPTPPYMPPPPDNPPPPYGAYGGGPHGAGFYPLDMGRVWSLTFSLYRFKFATFVGITLVVLVPVAMVTGLWSLMTFGSMNSWTTAMTNALRNGGDISDLMGLYPWGVIASGWVFSILTSVAGALASAAVIFAVMNTFTGTHATVAGSLRAAFGRLGGVLLLLFLIFGVIFLMTMAVALLFALALVGGVLNNSLLAFLMILAAVALVVVIIHVAMRMTLAMNSLIVEAQPATEALRRSWYLARGSLWRIGGYMLLFGIVTAIPALVATALIGTVFRPTLDYSTLTITYNPIGIFISSLASGVVAAAVAPISGIALTLLYLDIRFRRGERVPVPGVAAT